MLSVYNYGDTAINSGDLSQTEAHLYGSSRLGMATMSVNVQDTTAGATTNITGLGTGKNIIFRRGKKFFELTNHLGNVQATLSDRKIQVSGNGTTIDYYNADVVSAQDYYPFGMIQPGRSYNAGGYRYGFNGKENDNEVKGEGNELSYQNRVYDPRIGIWGSTDPIVKPWISTYQFAGDNPVNNLDPDGNDEIHFHYFTTSYLGANGVRTGKSSAMVVIVKENGPDRFFHHTHELEVRMPTRYSKGGASTFEKSVEFFPWRPDSRSGLTETSLFGLITRKDRDYVTLMKYASASPVVEDEIRKRATGYTATPYDKESYKGLLHDLPGYNGLRYTQAGAEVTANVLMTIEGGVSLIKLTANPFSGLTPGQAGVTGENLMFEALTAKYAGQNVTITKQVYFKMFGGGMRADAVVTDAIGNVLEVGESKFNTSVLSNGQKLFFLEKQMSKMTGEVAEGAKLNDIKVDPSKVVLSEYRWNPDGSGYIISH
ncbi:RHS repeat-associated core domain-containing protein [Chitinophaga sp. LS1]|uniref:RHS repeat-associated core domain-containing protein n=1 Tax=Chitinophaga sp. LS1 TaxID=3051176 RepID=UPI0026848D7E|nr:RHS repeat-associated core domain-containing protein [Chitinophaga sp. LS1]WPV66721.1 RHS repeat-associated core domain-containing protein [Chitinophaga sp. LS1]